MTANAGQTSTKFSIVINNLNNDSSDSSDTIYSGLSSEFAAIEATNKLEPYLAAVPVPLEWKTTAVSEETIQSSRRSGESSINTGHLWPLPETIVVPPVRPLRAPLWTRQAIRLLFATQTRRKSRYYSQSQ